MLNHTRKNFQLMQQRQAELNGVEDHTPGTDLNFAVEPSISQEMETKIQEKADFLQRINIAGVTEIKGEKIGMFAKNPIASRTDTTLNDRQTTNPMDLESNKYECSKTDFDTNISYKMLDKWAKFPDFQVRWSNLVQAQAARDRMMIGFNGVSRAADTSLADNPLLQDVNIGWLEKIRANKGGARYAASYTFAAGGNVNNADALVLDMIASFIDPWHRNSTELVVLAGRSILADKYTALVSSNEKPTERVALQTLMSNKQLGSVPTLVVPFFPDNAIAVGILPALSIYFQTGSRRRTIVDNAKRDRIEDYQSVNEDYVIEDFGAWAFIEDIKAPTV